MPRLGREFVNVLAPVRRRVGRAWRRAGAAWNDAEAAAFDRRFGTDTAGKIYPDALGMTQVERDHARGYQAVHAGHFKRALAAIETDSGSGFLDLGCGKGKALLLACRDQRFVAVRGVDIADKLCAIARVNLSREASSRAKRVEVRRADAGSYAIPSDINVIFLFNPFDGILLERVLENIESSLANCPRRLWLLYYNARFKELIARRPKCVLRKQYNFFGPGRNIAIFEYPFSQG